MNKRQKKKLKKRHGRFHYRDIVTVKFRIIGANDVYDRNHRKIDWASWKKALEEVDTGNLMREWDHPETVVAQSMSIRMVGGKIHSFSIDKPIGLEELLTIRSGMPLLKRPLKSNYGNMRVPWATPRMKTDYPSEVALSLRMPDDIGPDSPLIKPIADRYKEILGGENDVDRPI